MLTSLPENGLKTPVAGGDDFCYLCILEMPGQAGLDAKA